MKFSVDNYSRIEEFEGQIFSFIKRDSERIRSMKECIPFLANW